MTRLWGGFCCPWREARPEEPLAARDAPRARPPPGTVSEHGQQMGVSQLLKNMFLLI